MLRNSTTMIARPAIATLGCCSCRSSVIRAVLGSTATKARFLGQPQRRTFQSSTRGFLSSKSPQETGANRQIEEIQESTSNEENEEGEKPWFLEEEPPRHAPSLHKPTLPQAPEGAPALVDPMISYIYEDMGLDDISLLDLRELDPPAALGANLIMLFATARSERHLHVSAGRFVRWLKRTYKVNARADGLIGPGELKTKLRRLKKKAKLMGTNTMIVPGGDNGISTGWVCVNFSAAGQDTDEASSFDESGRFSGFGSSLTGTTVVVQCLTESRRSELDLETLWQGILRRSLEQTSKIKGEKIEDRATYEKMVSLRMQQPANQSASQWQALQQASQQQRHFSTLARRLQPRTEHRASAVGEGMPEPESLLVEETNQLDLGRVRRRISELQTSGASISQEGLESLISAIFRAAPSTSEDSSERVALVDGLLLTAQERGMVVWSKEILVTLIESVVDSPVYGPELQRSQRNLEFLLVEMQSALDEPQVLRLMSAYARQQDWERFWDVFRSQARFQVARSSKLYELAYSVMADTRDPKLCTDVLRWVYPEMLKEEFPVPVTGSLYDALKACILVADPAAESLLHNPPEAGRLSLLGSRRLLRREFVAVLKEVEALRRQMVGTRARHERAQALNKLADIASPDSA
ncbi:ATPase synthesis protein 25 mitochondrial [Purpureocillium takamizusanense]|uniref:ATPase synthesis protein 25 n=1 Tax=Purpureocillium takamizusanense TaxID=2060973 RepID=A0A9Q8QCG5_9HYPO|nr:ATPase synthesis protein 25 mitochondrial [Purpureocillium takamizusanense]UNI16798.1 ATPase synthesis protein 25 mitochondrial [Purpureocillium takamizusanense]